MEITKEETETKGRFVAWDHGQEIGELTYSLANDGQLLIADHTGVEPDYKGKGVGMLLFEELVKVARSEQRKIMPLCPFVRSAFAKNEDKWDVLRHGSL